MNTKLAFVLTFLLWVIINPIKGQSGQFDLRFSVSGIDCIANTILIDIEIRAESSATQFNLADQNYRFSFNRNALANPQINQELTISGIVSTVTPIATSSFYGTHTMTGSGDTVVSYNIELVGGDGYPLDDETYVKVGRFQFDILDVNECVDLKFHSADPIIHPVTFISEKFESNLYPALEGSFNNYSQCLIEACINQNVIAENDSVSTVPGQIFSFNVLQNDSDPENMLDVLSINLVSVPPVTEGTTFLDQATGIVYFIPAANFLGDVTPFQYEICDINTSFPSSYGNGNTASPSNPVPPIGSIPGPGITCDTAFIFIHVNYETLIASFRAILEGPYEKMLGSMNDYLRKDSLIPLNEPYSAVSSYVGQETTTYHMLDSLEIIDWVLVELRDKNDSLQVVTSKAVLLDKNGWIRGLDGSLELMFQTPPDNYFVSIVHRNHLNVLTKSAHPLSMTRDTIDFTIGTTILAGQGDARRFFDGKYMLWTGDIDYSNSIDGGDRSISWNTRNQLGYIISDCTLNGKSDAGDRSKIWNNRNKTIQYQF